MAAAGLCARARCFVGRFMRPKSPPNVEHEQVKYRGWLIILMTDAVLMRLAVTSVWAKAADDDPN